MYKPALVAAAISGALAVALGAFGAHGLKNLVDEHWVDIYQKGVTYQFYHTFAILATGILYMSFPSKQMIWAKNLFIAGILCFSGSLFAMTFLSIKNMSLSILGPITPLGGLMFIAGWLCMLAGILKKK